MLESKLKYMYLSLRKQKIETWTYLSFKFLSEPVMYDLGENLQGPKDNTENRKSKVPVSIVTVYIYTVSVKN